MLGLKVVAYIDSRLAHKVLEQSLSACIENMYVCLWNWFIQFFERKKKVYLFHKHCMKD